MNLRKCPSCKDTVGAESEECPRCGVNFKAAQRRRIVIWTVVVVLIAWVVSHFLFNVL